jgi:hypothetical protein
MVDRVAARWKVMNRLTDSARLSFELVIFGRTPRRYSRN